MKSFARRLAPLLLLVAGLLSSMGHAQTDTAKIGIVLMHGKGSSPVRVMSVLASALEAKGFRVTNLEMPWSGERQYDVSVSAAEQEVENALQGLRQKGADKVFIAGHSQGGVFAFHFGTRHDVDGVIAMAPGGTSNSTLFRDKLGDSMATARKLAEAGKGDEKTQLQDYEGSRGNFPVLATPAVYISWFDPDGAMDQLASLKKIRPKTPVLYVAPTGDYPALVRTKSQMFGALPSNPLTRLYEPSATHAQTPAVCADEIARWTQQVAGQMAGKGR
jgi:pimeloyl-ACP methyl ester carboxylesterase